MRTSLIPLFCMLSLTAVFGTVFHNTASGEEGSGTTITFDQKYQVNEKSQQKQSLFAKYFSFGKKPNAETNLADENDLTKNEVAPRAGSVWASPNKKIEVNVPNVPTRNAPNTAISQTSTLPRQVSTAPQVPIPPMPTFPQSPVVSSESLPLQTPTVPTISEKPVTAIAESEKPALPAFPVPSLPAQQEGNNPTFSLKPAVHTLIQSRNLPSPPSSAPFEQQKQTDEAAAARTTTTIISDVPYVPVNNAFPIGTPAMNPPNQTIFPISPVSLIHRNEPGESPATPGYSIGQLQQIALQNNPALQNKQREIREKYGISGQSAQSVDSLSIQVAKREYEIAQWKVCNDVQVRCYDLLATRYLIAVYSRLAAIAQEGVRISDSIVKTKQTGQSEFLQNRVMFNKALIELKKAESDENEIWLQLVALIGQPEMSKQPITDNLLQTRRLPGYDAVLQNILTYSPELQLENDQNQGNVMRARAKSTLPSGETERLQSELRKRLNEEWNNYQKSLETIDFYEKTILVDARESVDLSIRGLPQGEVTSPELLIAQQTYYRSMIEYIEAMRSLVRSKTYIDGMLLKGGLEKN